MKNEDLFNRKEITDIVVDELFGMGFVPAPLKEDVIYADRKFTRRKVEA